MASSEESSSVGDIPSGSKHEAKADANAAAEDPVEDEDEDDGEEYAVAKILTHKFSKSGDLKYNVKWVGYDETTWEIEDNLDGCPDELEDYFKKFGGRPQFDGKAGKGTPKSTFKYGGEASGFQTSAKRRLSSTDTGSPTGSSHRGRKKTKTADGEDKGAGGGITIHDMDGERSWKAPPGSWENEIISVDTVERGEGDGQLYAFIVWRSGKKSKHQTRVLHSKCPHRMLQFYEAHLVFNPQPKNVISPWGDEQEQVAETGETGDGAEEDDDMSGVKPVAR